jgi:hypothetical protein
MPLPDGAHESLGALEGTRRTNLTHLNGSVVGVFAETPVFPDDAAQAALIAMPSIDQQPDKLRIDEGVPPLAAAAWRSDSFEQEGMNGGLKDGVIAAIRRVVVPTALIGPSCTLQGLPGFLKEHSAQLEHARPLVNRLRRECTQLPTGVLANGPGRLAERRAEDPDLFAERIPFGETSHYVQVVYENYGNYRRLYR